MHNNVYIYYIYLLYSAMNICLNISVYFIIIVVKEREREREIIMISMLMCNYYNVIIYHNQKMRERERNNKICSKSLLLKYIIIISEWPLQAKQ